MLNRESRQLYSPLMRIILSWLWLEGKADPLPIVLFFLGVIISYLLRVIVLFNNGYIYELACAILEFLKKVL